MIYFGLYDMIGVWQQFEDGSIVFRNDLLKSL